VTTAQQAETTQERPRPTTDELIQTFREMTLAELHAFVRRFEATFGIRADLHQVVVREIDRAAAADEPDEPALPSHLDVVVTAIADGSRVAVIREVRALRKAHGQELPLAAAKALVERLPSLVLARVPAEEVTIPRTRLQAAGATVELHPTQEED
jgi:large subunit ribosomal protein L7/L12